MATITPIMFRPSPIRTPIRTTHGSGSIVTASQTTRPLWFDGRFLAARDLERDQMYFLKRQAALGRAAGFGVIHGLWVDRFSQQGQPPDAETLIIRAGQGLTPGGFLVMLSTDLTIRISDLAEEESLEEQFGLSSAPMPVARTRTGLFVIALRPVQFTANPISAYPASIQGSMRTQDGDVVEATAISLVPYPLPATNYAAATQNAAVARAIFLDGNVGPVSESLLPLAIVSIERDVIQWVDPYLVRRDSGPEFSGLNFGLADPATQQAFLLQYDAQLQSVVGALTAKNQPAKFAATDYFQLLPPVGRLPLQSIDVINFRQQFFPQLANVQLNLVPADEIPALIEDGLSLAPIDLTLPASAYADLSVSVLVPVPRAQYAGLAESLNHPVPLAAAVPPLRIANLPAAVLASPARTALLARPQLSSLPAALVATLARTALVAPPPVSGNWPQAVGTQTYGYYVRSRSAPIFPSGASAAAATATTLAAAAITGYSGFVLTATVTPASASGTVTFADGTTTLGTVDLSAGTATLTYPSLTSGAHTLSATYNGDPNFAGSSSPPVSETVP